jgi:uncharacterized protein YodC (DUF2158 family)
MSEEALNEAERSGDPYQAHMATEQHLLKDEQAQRERRQRSAESSPPQEETIQEKRPEVRPIREGDIVQLLSGGPPMMTSLLHRMNIFNHPKTRVKPRIWCTWFHEGEIRKHAFYLDELRHFAPERLPVAASHSVTLRSRSQSPPAEISIFEGVMDNVRTDEIWVQAGNGII